MREADQGARESTSIKPEVFIFVGPEGSGKSTQSKLLAKKLGTPFISVGDLLRDKAKNDTGELGDACRDMFARHDYLEPSLVRKVVVERISGEDTTNGFVLDGANRTIEEAEHFPETLLLARRDSFGISTISLRVPGWESTRRLIKVRAREDDTVEGVLKRLGKYYESLGRRVGIMREIGRFIQVDGNKSVEEVHDRIVERLAI